MVIFNSYVKLPEGTKRNVSKWRTTHQSPRIFHMFFWLRSMVNHDPTFDPKNFDIHKLDGVFLCFMARMINSRIFGAPNLREALKTYHNIGKKHQQSRKKWTHWTLRTKKRRWKKKKKKSWKKRRQIADGKSRCIRADGIT